METQSMIQLWLVSCWLAAILFVIGWTVWGVNMIVTDKQVLQAATVIRGFENTQRQFAMFIQAVNAKSPEDDKPIEIDPGTLAEMRSMWMMIEKESQKLGITPQEFMLRVSKLMEDRKQNT